MKIIHQAPLKSLHTFGIETNASQLIIIEKDIDIDNALMSISNEDKRLVLGSGSNMLFTKDYDGTIIRSEANSIRIIKETAENIIIEADGGTEWDYLVDHCVKQNWGGLENLSYIPGTVGACPVQNIGAYGVEVADCIDYVSGIYLDSASMFSLKAVDCNFGYRDSIFKRELKNKCMITSVRFKLSKNPIINIEYADLRGKLEQYANISIANVREEVTNIRKSKLPDPLETGNAGSFFKNPSISPLKATELKNLFPEIKTFQNTDGSIKIPAAFLIEQCGWKGYRKGDAGVHHKQCLVLVNHGNAKGKEIIDLANEIIDSVVERFGVRLQMEVNVID